jgi:predicted phosphodiesterase
LIYITGDTHGCIDIKKLNMKNFPQQKNLTKDDYVIICGDFGMVWNNDNEDKYWQKWITEKNFTTLFVDGNHEGFTELNKYPTEKWKGGKVHRVTNSIYHLMRGQVFTIENKTFFTMGGATSVDKLERKENISWWKEEIPNYKEMNEGLLNLERHNWNVDYILSHCCSAKTLQTVGLYCGFNGSRNIDTLNRYFDEIELQVDYKHWYFGHYHNDVKEIVTNQTLVYSLIHELKIN